MKVKQVASLMTVTVAVAVLASQVCAAVPTGFSVDDWSGRSTTTNGRDYIDFYGTIQPGQPSASGTVKVELHALNNSGAPVGEYTNSSNDTVAFKDKVADLGVMPYYASGGWLNYLSDINDSGVVVGSYSKNNPLNIDWWAMRASSAWNSGTPELLYSGINKVGVARSINSNGYVVGSVDSAGAKKAVLWANDATAQTSAGTTFLNMDAANNNLIDNNSMPACINDAMNICGAAYGDNPDHIVAWVTGAGSTTVQATISVPTSVYSGAGFKASYADDMNTNGTVVGSMGAAIDDVVPFVWKPDTANGVVSTTGPVVMTSVTDGVTTDTVEVGGQRGMAYAINDSELAVGWTGLIGSNDVTAPKSMIDSSNGYMFTSYMNDTVKAFIWDTTGQQGVYLESLLSQADQDTYELLIATDINNSDQVSVLYKLDADITANGFAAAPIYAGILNVDGGPVLVPGDCDGDGDVDLTDLAILASNYGATEPPALAHGDGDFDDDGDVDLTDLAILANNWGFGTMTAVPEPATMGLLSLGGLAMIRRRRA